MSVFVKSVQVFFYILVVCLYLYCHWRSNYQAVRVGIPLTGLPPPHLCVCPGEVDLHFYWYWWSCSPSQFKLSLKWYVACCWCFCLVFVCPCLYCTNIYLHPFSWSFYKISEKHLILIRLVFTILMK